jgi:hypothetical protein
MERFHSSAFSGTHATQVPWAKQDIPMDEATDNNGKPLDNGGKPDYLKRIWYLALFGFTCCVLLLVAVVVLAAIYGPDNVVMASMRDMRLDTRQMHDAMMEGQKAASESIKTLRVTDMVNDARDAIAEIAGILKNNPAIVQQTLTQLNLLITHIQTLSAKFTPDQLDAVKQDVIQIAHSTKEMLSNIDPVKINLSMSKFHSLADSAVNIMNSATADNLVHEISSAAQTANSMGQRLLDTEQIVFQIPKGTKK